MQEIKGFSYATALDLNMGYYTIRLDPDASKICTIIFPWGILIGIAGSPDIFQEKMLELMKSLEFVRAYLDNLLCNLDKLEVVLWRLRDAGLKVNAAKRHSAHLK